MYKNLIVRFSGWRVLWSWLEPLVLAVVITQFGVTLVGVDGASMMPNLRDHERLLVPKYETWLHKLGVGDFKRGDILVFKPPTQALNRPLLGNWLGQWTNQWTNQFNYRPFLVKRLIGLPGDWVRMSGGEVFVNGARVSQQFTAAYWRAQGCWDQSSLIADNARLDTATGRVSSEVTLGAGQYFLMGDNRSAVGSEDSRLFGPVAQRDIAGRAAAVVWPMVRRRVANYECQATSRPQDHVRFSGPAALNLRLLKRPAAFGESLSPR
ncbi:signal peptidase I [Deinococcus rubellus]|uniref:Signal peptidase I n=1 Tax=Deinococcus rubellus TaxID=1889240 RepID=A0ABY5YD42_9DEIO|nr:signal peptidase I [Deinococcus rubellus]UWX62990.1 signal peptidase I [Deinococcus rubellus]